MKITYKKHVEELLTKTNLLEALTKVLTKNLSNEKVTDEQLSKMTVVHLDFGNNEKFAMIFHYLSKDEIEVDEILLEEAFDEVKKEFDKINENPKKMNS